MTPDDVSIGTAEPGLRDRAPDVLVRQPTAGEFALEVSRSREASGVVRDAMERWLSTQACPSELGADVLIVVSELVTNAVVHAQSAALVMATLGDDRLGLEVFDRSPTPPRPRVADDVPGGYGLQIVARLADRWGWSPTPGGKVVWTEHEHLESMKRWTAGEPCRLQHDRSWSFLSVR